MRLDLTRVPTQGPERPSEDRRSMPIAGAYAERMLATLVARNRLSSRTNMLLTMTADERASINRLVDEAGTETVGLWRGRDQRR